jgi:hypothetical protein
LNLAGIMESPQTDPIPVDSSRQERRAFGEYAREGYPNVREAGTVKDGIRMPAIAALDFDNESRAVHGFS